MSHAMWKALLEVSQPRGLVFSGTLTAIGVSIQRTGKHLASRGVSSELLFPTFHFRFTAEVK